MYPPVLTAAEPATCTIRVSNRTNAVQFACVCLCVCTMYLYRRGSTGGFPPCVTVTAAQPATGTVLYCQTVLYCTVLYYTESNYRALQIAKSLRIGTKAPVGLSVVPNRTNMLSNLKIRSYSNPYSYEYSHDEYCTLYSSFGFGTRTVSYRIPYSTRTVACAAATSSLRVILTGFSPKARRAAVHRHGYSSTSTVAIRPRRC